MIPPCCFLRPAACSVALLLCAGCAPRSPRPADLRCLRTGPAHGEFIPLPLSPRTIYGLGLTYSSHIRETGSRGGPGSPPPVFTKAAASLNAEGKTIPIPSREQVTAALERLEPGLGDEVAGRFTNFPLLLDYEVELGLVLLEGIDWGAMDDPGYSPRIGYFIANDVSARAIAVLGEGRPDFEKYWSASKSFPGFLPVGRRMWVPRSREAGSTLCTALTTRVNGRLRQDQSTTDLIYTPKEMIRFIARSFPGNPPRKGDMILTGTPGGVALRVPRWKRAAADLLRLDRFTRLSALLRSTERGDGFLKAGDTVDISGGFLGSVRSVVAPSRDTQSGDPAADYRE